MIVTNGHYQILIDKSNLITFTGGPAGAMFQGNVYYSLLRNEPLHDEFTFQERGSDVFDIFVGGKFIATATMPEPGAWDKILARLRGTADSREQRIAELEAEIARLKRPPLRIVDGEHSAHVYQGGIFLAQFSLGTLDKSHAAAQKWIDSNPLED